MSSRLCQPKQPSPQWSGWLETQRSVHFLDPREFSSFWMKGRVCPWVSSTHPAGELPLQQVVWNGLLSPESPVPKTDRFGQITAHCYPPKVKSVRRHSVTGSSGKPPRMCLCSQCSRSLKILGETDIFTCLIFLDHQDFIIHLPYRSLFFGKKNHKNYLEIHHWPIRISGEIVCWRWRLFVYKCETLYWSWLTHRLTEQIRQ